MSETSLPRHRLTCVCPKCKVAPTIVALSYNAEGFLFLDLMCPMCLERLTFAQSLFGLIKSAIDNDSGISKIPSNRELEKTFAELESDRLLLRGLAISVKENDDTREEE